MQSDALSAAISGLNVQKLRLQATASNVANVSTSGAAPGSAEAVAGASVVYRPLAVNASTQILANGEAAGVSGSVTEIENGYSFAFDPAAAGASPQGLVAVPNVDLAQEMVNLLEIKSLYKANAAVIRTQNEMSGDLMDIIS